MGSAFSAPHYKKRKNPLCSEALKFISDILGSTSFKGLICLAKKNDSVLTPICFVRQDQLIEYLSHMEIYLDSSYYISAASFKQLQRSIETIFSYNAIVIDIDCHSDTYTDADRTELIDTFIWRLQNDCLACNDLPNPNYIVKTGRGVQIWWAVTPVFAPKFVKCFSDITNHFIATLQNLVDEFPSELSDLTIDRSASTNSVGLFRLPGSVNPLTHSRVEVIPISDTRLDMPSYRDKILPYSALPTKSNPKRHAYASGLKTLVEKRIAAITKLRDMRSAPAGCELRNNFCLLYYALLKSIYDEKDVIQRLHEFNSGFKVPMTERELKSTLTSARRKDYKFRTQTIKEFLNITDDEAIAIGLYAPSPSSRNGKVDRDNNIISLYSQGIKKSEIAKKLGVSWNTVAAVIKSRRNQCVSRSSRMQALYDAGVSVAEIANQMHCSTRTVYRHISAHCDKILKNPPIYGLYFAPKEGAPVPSQSDSDISVDTAHQNAVNCKNGTIIETLKQQIPNLSSERLFEIGDLDITGLDKYLPAITRLLSFEENDVLVNALSADTALRRTEAAVIACLLDSYTRLGNLYIPENSLANQVDTFLHQHAAPIRRNLSLNRHDIAAALANLIRHKSVIRVNDMDSGTANIYLPQSYKLETNVNAAVISMIKTPKGGALSAQAEITRIAEYEVNNKLTLSSDQKNAVHMAISEPMSIVTGGPGTGKTAVLGAICSILAKSHKKVVLCAPTGKAAVRLSEATKMPASTINALILRRKINCDYLVIDETSMVSMELFAALADKVSHTARMILVGDCNQLPCIGSGNLLQELIASHKVATVRLTTVYRQTENSGINLFARQIANYQQDRTCFSHLTMSSSLSSLSGDMCFLPADDISEIKSTAISAFDDLLHVYGIPESKIQILSPTKEIAEELNYLLRDSLRNGDIDDQGRTAFYPGDRVIYCKNDYTKKLYNGMAGTVKSVGHKSVTVKYGERVVRHKLDDISNIKLAYALTVHKSQGNEYPIVIIPIHETMGNLLIRNLLYTGVTRAKAKCILIGSQVALNRALRRGVDGHRSMLATRIQSLLTNQIFTEESIIL